MLEVVQGITWVSNVSDANLSAESQQHIEADIATSHHYMSNYNG